MNMDICDHKIDPNSIRPDGMWSGKSMIADIQCSKCKVWGSIVIAVGDLAWDDEGILKNET